jgi:putative nucleotidyltransferase with HDIG domain
MAFVTATALATAASLAIWGGRPAGWDWLGVGGLALMSGIGERGRVQLDGVEVSVSLLPAIFAAVVIGPLAAMIVFGVSIAANDMPRAGRITYGASRALTGAAAAGAAAAVSLLVDHGVGKIVATAAVAALVAEVVDAAAMSVTHWLRGRGTLSEAVHGTIPVVVASVPFYASGVATLALAYEYVSPWTLPLFFVPALAAQRWFLMYQDQSRLTAELTDLNATLEAANLSFASALVTTLDARDRYTAGHSAAVAVYARDIASRMGLDDAHQRLAHLCGLVHDIGKIGLPAGLLEKPGALTLDERREMQRHSEIGERILSKVETYAEIASVVRHHHERVDGQGYPDGICADEIPLLARIIAVADAYNAMTSDRPYRDAMPTQVARLRLAQAVETQFDTAVVAAFEAILAGATEDYRLAKGEEFYLAVEREESSVLVSNFVPMIASAMAS